MISQVSYHRKPKRGRGHIYRLLSFGLLCAWMVTWSGVALAETTLPESILAFFENNCHDGDSAKGELDLKSLAFKPNDRADLKRWSLVYDRVRHHEIPPKGKANGRDAFLKEFETLMHNTSEAHQTAKCSVRSRRLNRTEFENTLHDLLGIDLPLSERLPGDATKDGFNKVAESQPVSYHLLEKYMEVVDHSLDEAFRRATEPMPEYKRSFKAKDLSDNFNDKRRRRDRQPLFKDGHAVAMAASNNYHSRMSATRVPATGWYRFTINAKALNPKALPTRS
jgi:hypothetical protein